MQNNNKCIIGTKKGVNKKKITPKKQSLKVKNFVRWSSLSRYTNQGEFKDGHREMCLKASLLNHTNSVKIGWGATFSF